MSHHFLQDVDFFNCFDWNYYLSLERAEHKMGVRGEAPDNGGLGATPPAGVEGAEPPVGVWGQRPQLEGPAQLDRFVGEANESSL